MSQTCSRTSWRARSSTRFRKDQPTSSCSYPSNTESTGPCTNDMWVLSCPFGRNDAPGAKATVRQCCRTFRNKAPELHSTFASRIPSSKRHFCPFPLLLFTSQTSCFSLKARSSSSPLPILRSSAGQCPVPTAANLLEHASGQVGKTLGEKKLRRREGRRCAPGDLQSGGGDGGG